jgi:hypothetical protein
MARTRVVKMNAEPEFHDRLKEAAKQERRSVSDLLHLMAEEWLEQHRY